MVTRHFGAVALGMLLAPVIYFAVSPWLGAALGLICYPLFLASWVADLVGWQ